jgi:hypothetical protein
MTDDLDEVIATLQWSAVVQRERRLATSGDEWPKGAVKVTKNLDLLVEQDEPTQLVEELRKVAERLVDESSQGELWELVAKSMVELSSDMRAKNEPGHSTDAKDE